MKAKLEAKELTQTVKALSTLEKLDADIKKKPDEEGGFKGIISVKEGELVFDVTNYGAYVRKTVQATTLREGSVGINFKDLQKLKLTGGVVVEHIEEKGILVVKTPKVSYDIPADQDSVGIVQAARPEERNIPPIAKVPTVVLANAAQFVALEPALKQEDMRLQFGIKKHGDKVSVEMVGCDNYSYARYSRTGKGIHAKRSAHFIVRSTSLSTILGSLTSKTVMVGVEMRNEDDDVGQLVRFKSEDADIFYPTLDIPYLDTSEVKRDTTSGTLDCAFTVERRQLREAITSVKTVSKSAAIPLLLNIRVDKKTVKMGAEQDRKVAVATISAKDIEVGDNPFVIHLNQHYLENILKLAPEVSPLRMESWNGSHVMLKVAGVEDGGVEYYMGQMDLNALEEEES